MSLDVAIGQIDQIMQLQQQLADPSALASALVSGSEGAGLSTGGPATSFADVLAATQASRGAWPPCRPGRCRRVNIDPVNGRLAGY